jgi:BON domain
MRSRQAIALLCGASLVLALAPRLVQAQASTASSSSNLLPTTSSSGGGGGGSTSQSVSPAVGSGLINSATTIAASSGTPSATSIPSNANVLGSSYVNYFTLGQSQNYQGKFGAQNVTPNITGTFGKYIYVPNPSTSTGGASTTPTQGIGFSTFGQPRAPVYTTSFAETFPIVRPELSQVQVDARDAIARSSLLKNRGSIQVTMNRGVVQLTGSVGSETERITAEGMVRMTPGVAEVQNNLVVDSSKR